ncbi:hypothetical protein BpHYR1_054582, partial [Brachionus plicatilis]
MFLASRSHFQALSKSGVASAVGVWMKALRLVITHWNCLHLPSRVHLLASFLAQKCPDIVLLNELKIDLSEANIYLDFHNYQFITKPHNKYGGGVAILIKEGIEFIQDFSYEEFNSELLCIKMNLGKNSELF